MLKNIFFLRTKIILLFIICSASIGYAQFDIKFWMSPVWDSQNGNQNNPTELVITTIYPNSTVTVQTPDGVTFNQTYNITSNAPLVIPLTTTLGMTANINQAENNKGFLITASSPIQAVYRINGIHNKVIATLKGQTALGTEFYAGSQTFLLTDKYSDNDYHFISVMATEDNTSVTFETEQGFVFEGQSSNPFTINLNEGETYLVRSNDNLNQSVAGTHITSDKDITVISGAQHPRINGGGNAADAGIDQIVGTDHIGSEYLVVRGSLNSGFDYAMITATQDNTVISVDGSVIATINQGETHEYHLPGGSGDIGTGHYIETSQPAYLYHVTGENDDEVGMAILPSLNCTGSRYLQFPRFDNANNGVTITIPDEGLASLTLNGSHYTTYGTVTSKAIVGYPGYTAITLRDADIQTNNTFQSEEAFHLAILIGTDNAGTYGFLSGFNSSIDILDPETLIPLEIMFADSVEQGKTTETCILMRSCGAEHEALSITNSPNTGGTSIQSPPSDTCINYTAKADFTGYDTIWVKVTNEFGFADSAQIVYYVYAPIQADPITLEYDVCAVSSNTIDLIDTYVTDPDGDYKISDFSITEAPTGAGNTASINSNGQLIFTPGTDFYGTDEFIYEACDSTGLCDTALVSVSVPEGASVDAGEDSAYCSNNPYITLDGTITKTTEGYWSGGNGTFITDSNSIDAFYIPTDDEVASGNLELYLTSSDETIVPIEFLVSEDVEDKATSTQLASGDIESPKDGIVGLRFTNIDIPQGTKIHAAYLQFTARGTGTSGVHTSTIALENSANAITFTSANDDVVNRNYLPTTVSWSPDPWLVGNENGDDQRTPNVGELVQSIVDRGDWTEGNAMVFKWDGAGDSRRAHALEGNEANSVYLRIEYIVTGCPVEQDTVNFTFTPSPTVEAGDSLTFCENSTSDIPLDGSFTISPGAIWSNFDGTISDPIDMQATYSPSQDEIDAGESILILTTTDNGNCNAEADTMIISYDNAPTVDAGNDTTMCSYSTSIQLNGSSPTTSTGEWFGGSGTYSSSNTDLNAFYTPTASEITSGSLTLKLRSTNNGECEEAVDSMVITFTDAPDIEITDNTLVCENNPAFSVTATFNHATGLVWSTIGDGKFSPDLTSTTVDFLPSEDDIDNGVAVVIATTTGNGECLANSDTTAVIFLAAPTSDAGDDQIVCRNNADVSLVGIATNQTAVSWSGGNGSFTNSSSANTVYTPSTDELLNSCIQLYYTAKAPAFNCIDVTDTVEICFSDAPTVQAGSDIEVCENNPDIELNGTVLIASGGTWSGGNGSYSPDNNSLSTTYTPTSTEVNSGTMSLILTSTVNGDCVAESDTISITFSPSPEVTPGTYTPVCANNASIALSGNVSIADNGVWSGGNGTYSPSSSNLTTTYSPSDDEINNGSVTLTLTSTGNGDCIAETNTTTIQITDAPTVDAGSSQTICADNAVASLVGSFTVANGSIWSGGAGIFSPNTDSLSITYTPTTSEITTESVTLYLTTVDNGNCNAVSDSTVITIQKTPTIKAVADQTVCGNADQIELSGSVENATGTQWSTLGSGSFESATSLNTQYNISQNDINSGLVKLVLATTGTGVCQTYRDTISITFSDVPVADAGIDGFACTAEMPIQLNASGTVGEWFGAGTFSDPSSFNATYQPTDAEITAQSATVKYKTNPIGACSPDSAEVTFEIVPSPEAFAGEDTTLCASTLSLPLNGVVGNSSGGQWSTLGFGHFDDAGSLSTTYNIHVNDTIGGEVKIVLTTTGSGVCNTNSDTLVITFTPAVRVSAGVDQDICANVTSFPLLGNVDVAEGATWSTTGTGTFSPNDSVLTGTYIPSTADTTAGEIQLVLTTYGNGICTELTDTIDINFTPAPTIEAGTPITACVDTNGVQVTATVNIATSGIWSTDGGGSFSPTPVGLTSTYTPTDEDTTNGGIYLKVTSTGNGTCLPVEDSVFLNLEAYPEITLASTGEVCTNSDSLTLMATTTNSSASLWTSSGTGVIETPASLTSLYDVTTTDSLTGIITFTLTAEGLNVCEARQEIINYTFIPGPQVSVGSDLLACMDEDEVAVSASVLDASGVTWTTSGTGTFESANSLNTNYLPSVNDTTLGSVFIIATTTGQVSCDAAIDTLELNFQSIPIAFAGNDTLLCGDLAPIAIEGTATNASGGTWSIISGDGNFLPSSTFESTNYIPVSSDTTSGEVQLLFTTTGNGVCNASLDTLAIFFNKQPVPFAGLDTTICASQSVFDLDGFITNGGSGVWATTGSGTFSPDMNTIDATYTPSSLDTAAGTINITLTTVAANLCGSQVDIMTLNFQSAIEVDAGNDLAICELQDSIQLDGKTYNTTGATWSASSGGIFYTSETDESALYFHQNTADTIQIILTGNAFDLCPSVSDTLQLIVTDAPTLEAGANRTLCNDGGSTSLSASFTGANGVEWSTNGNGSFFPSYLNADVTYAPDQSDNVVTIYLTTTGNGLCPAQIDSLIVTAEAPPTVFAGDDLDFCRNEDSVQLSGTFSNAVTAQWTSSGTGVFSPDDAGNDSYYIPSDLDKLSDQLALTYMTIGSGTCDSIQDVVRITFREDPVANAGNDFEVCKTEDTVSLFGIASQNDGVYWFTNDGFGSFNGTSNQADAQYVVHENDTTQGFVNFYFYAFGLNGCATAVDTVTVTFTDQPSIEAGDDMTVCTDTSGFELNGSGISGSWSGGTGSFEPSADVLNAIYHPTVAELTTGSITLTLTSEATASCPEVSDVTTIQFTPLPAADAGNDITICGDSSSIELTGIPTNEISVKWVSLGGGTFDDETIDNPTYTPSLQDIADSAVTLTYVVFGDALCDSVTDNVTLYINPIPTVDAGEDQSICASGDQINLKATIDNATGVMWSTTGTGTIDNDNDLSTTYDLEGTDASQSTLLFIATSTGNGLCQAVEDTMELTLTSIPTLFAGADDTLCTSEDSYPLTGTVTIASGIQWSTTSNGLFSPSALNTSTSYVYSDDDVSAGSVEIIATSTSNGTCAPVTDTVQIVFEEQAVVNADAPVSICVSNVGVQMNGAVDKGNTYWESTGTGEFIDSSILNTTYLHSEQDISNGGVTFILNSEPTVYCPAATDVINLTIDPLKTPIVNAGFDQFVCEEDDQLIVTGDVLSTSGQYWKTLGSGTFKDSTDITTTYYFTDAEKAAGEVQIVLVTIAEGFCPSEEDTSTINILPSPTVEAGDDAKICSDLPFFSVDGSFSNAGGVEWSSTGSGEFNPSFADTVSTYTPSEEDINDGAVVLTLTTTDNGICSSTSDYLTLEIVKKSAPLAGTDFTLCADDTSLTVSGTVSDANEFYWSTSGSGTFADSSALTTTYTIAPEDSTTGLLVFNLIAQGDTTCEASSDQVLITLAPVPAIDAGLDFNVCENNSEVNLSPTIENVSNVFWSGGTGAFAPSNTTSDASYTPSQTDITNGFVDFVLTTVAENNCNVYTDSVRVVIEPQPEITAAISLPCYSPQDLVPLSGTVTNAGGINWSSTTNGTFSLSSAELNVNYLPTTEDLENTKGFFTATTTDNGLCNAVSTEVETYIKYGETLEQSLNRTVCVETNTTLTATHSEDVSFTWYKTNGDTISTTNVLEAFIANDTLFNILITDPFGCTTLDTVRVNAIIPITFDLASPICYTDSVELEANATNYPGVGSFNWFYQGVPIPGSDTTTFVETGQYGKGTYVIGFNYEYCSVYDTTLVTSPTPSNDATVNYCPKDVDEIDIDAGPGFSYLWAGSENTDQYETVDSADTYYFTIFDQYGCPTDDSITVDEVCEPEIVIPNGLANLGNGNGTQITINGKDFSAFDLKIYNRWGEIIFHSNDVNKTWDGTYLGNRMPVGVYQYVLTYEGIGSKYKGPYVKEGIITILD